MENMTKIQDVVDFLSIIEGDFVDKPLTQNETKEILIRIKEALIALQNRILATENTALMIEQADIRIEGVEYNR